MRHSSGAAGLALAVIVLGGAVPGAGAFEGGLDGSKAPAGQFRTHPIRADEGMSSTNGAIAAGAMTAHGGPVLSSMAVRALYAGPSWKNPAFVADKMTGLDTFFEGFGNSSYAATVQEYAGHNGSITNSVTYQGHGAPLPATLDGDATLDVATAACNEYEANLASMPNPGNELIFIISDKKRPAGGSYCAYHSAAVCDNGQTIQFGFVWNLDGDNSCNPNDTTTDHSEGLAALANVIAHEMQETRTDPHIDAWFDSASNEIGDKCAWTFGAVPVTLANGSRWKLQGEWSNAAYAAQSGFDNMMKQPACIDHAAAAGAPAGVAASKPAKAVPTLGVASTLRCPSVAVGASGSCTGSIVLSASGGKVVLAGSPVRITGTAGEFVVRSGSCTANRTLNAGTSCALGSITFSPRSTGTRSATISIAATPAGVSVTVSGAGASAVAAPRRLTAAIDPEAGEPNVPASRHRPLPAGR